MHVVWAHLEEHSMQVQEDRKLSLKSCPSCSAREGEHLYYPQDAFGFRTVGDGKYSVMGASCRGQRVALSAHGGVLRFDGIGRRYARAYLAKANRRVDRCELLERTSSVAAKRIGFNTNGEVFSPVETSSSWDRKQTGKTSLSSLLGTVAPSNRRWGDSSPKSYGRSTPSSTKSSPLQHGNWPGN